MTTNHKCKCDSSSARGLAETIVTTLIVTCMDAESQSAEPTVLTAELPDLRSRESVYREVAVADPIESTT